MPPAGFDPAIPASERPQIHALDRAATGIGDREVLGGGEKVHYKSNTEWRGIEPGPPAARGRRVTVWDTTQSVYFLRFITNFNKRTFDGE
jgi:hypothetical protein